MITRWITLHVYPSLRRWEVNGSYHSIADVPSLEWTDTGTRQWCKYGMLHRTGGLPAIQLSDGTGSCYLYNKLVTQAKSSAHNEVGYA